jgi:hypothetical protein
MKLRYLNLFWVLYTCTLLLSCNGKVNDNKETVQSLEARRFNAFAHKNQLAFPVEKQYYLIVQPKMCVSCVGYYLRTISSKIPKQGKLIVIGKADAQQEVMQYIDHPNSEYFGKFKNAELDREPFLKSGIAYASTEKGEVIIALAVNKSNLDGLDKR